MKLINCLCFCDSLNNIAFDMKGKLVKQKRVQPSHVFCLKIHINVVTNSCNAGSNKKYSTVKKG
jgi:hypothetical protein